MTVKATATAKTLANWSRYKTIIWISIHSTFMPTHHTCHYTVSVDFTQQTQGVFTQGGTNKMVANFADDILVLFLGTHFCIFIFISLTCVPYDIIDKKSPLLQVMARCRTVHKALHEPVITVLYYVIVSVKLDYHIISAFSLRNMFVGRFLDARAYRILSLICFVFNWHRLIFVVAR